MLYVQDKVLKLGGVYLGGQVTSVEVQEAGSVYVAQDEKGRYTKSQPVGYENAKVMVDILLEDTKTATTLEQLAEMQGLFKAYGQDKPNLMSIVNEDCAARGISSVYFKGFTSKKVISESKRIASLELWAPDTAEIQVKKTTQTEAATGTSTTQKAAITNMPTTHKESVAITAARESSIRSIKTKLKSPAVDSRDTSAGKKAAQACVIAGGKKFEG